ncbi:hypothetical protein HispidOSU_029415, partial [Sigmodon hispidus]
NLRMQHEDHKTSQSTLNLLRWHLYQAQPSLSKAVHVSAQCSPNLLSGAAVYHGQDGRDLGPCPA